LSCFTDCTKHPSAVALIHGNRQFIGFLHKQNSAASTEKFYYHLLGLDKTSSVAYNSGEIQTCNYYFIFFFYSSVEIDSGEIFASVWQEEGNFEVLKRCYTQIYPTSFLPCFGKAINLQHM